MPKFCNDPKHDTPCLLPCTACADECAPVLEPREAPLGGDMHEALERLAHYVYNSHAYDYVDDCVEIRLYGEAKDIFDNAIEHIEEKRHAKQV